MNTAVIGLGSNIDPDQNIPKAREALSKHFKIMGESRFIKTKPIGCIGEDFINGAVLIYTDATCVQLRSTLKDIEVSLGRTKEMSGYHARVIDLDMVIWNNAVVDDDFYKRDFVRQSVLELLPDLKYPQPNRN